MLDDHDMFDDVATDRDVTILAQRFLAETSEFLTRNWDVRRQWWPRRHAGVDAAPAPEDGAGIVPAAAQPEAPVGTRVLARRPDGPYSDAVEVDDLYLFILTPRTCDVDLLAARIRTALARTPAADDAEEWRVWVPETLSRHGGMIAPDEARLATAGVH